MFLGGLFRKRSQAKPAGLPAGSAVFCNEEEALWRLLHNPADHHHIAIYDAVLEPRSYGSRRNIEELAMFLACAGNKIDLYTPPETLQKFTDHPHHPFLNMLKGRKNACITPVVYTNKLNFMIGSHGQAYLRTPNSGGVFLEQCAELQGRLLSVVQKIDGHLTAPAPAV